jgi:hypothetical protein
MKYIYIFNYFLGLNILFIGKLLGQDPRSLIELDQVADLLKFPRSELVITDYIKTSKFIYTKKNSSEENNGRMPPVNPESIYQSYKIESKTENAFLPIIITLSKRDAFLTPEVKKIIADYNEYASTKRARDAHFAYGDFKLMGASHASIYLKDIRIPADIKHVIEPGDTWTRLDEYPTSHSAIVSIVRDASSEVDVRIAQYTCLTYPNELVKVAGGGEYFAAFNDDAEDDPIEHPLLNIFKGLNQIVLTSPMMNPYRTTPIPPLPLPEPPKEEPVKPTENPAASQLSSTSLPQPSNLEDSSRTLKILVLILLALATFAAIIFKIRMKRN